MSVFEAWVWPYGLVVPPDYHATALARRRYRCCRCDVKEIVEDTPPVCWFCGQSDKMVVE